MSETLGAVAMVLVAVLGLAGFPASAAADVARQTPVQAALEIAGAPASATMVCDPAFTGENTEGLADPSTGRAWLGVSGCRAILADQLTDREYRQVERMNNLMLGWYQGEGLLVILHEARHLAGETNECLAERFAITHVGELISRFVPARERVVAGQAAYMLDGVLDESPAYHDGC